jgi:hypothetical protein
LACVEIAQGAAAGDIPAAGGRWRVARQALGSAIGEGAAAVDTRGWRTAFSAGAMTLPTRRKAGPSEPTRAPAGAVGPHDAPSVAESPATATDEPGLGGEASTSSSCSDAGPGGAGVARQSPDRAPGQAAVGQAAPQGGPHRAAGSVREIGSMQAEAGARAVEEARARVGAEVAVRLVCTTKAEVEVGLPSPFTYAPKPLVQGAANLVSY